MLQRRWRCPGGGHTPDPRALDAGCLKAREDVARLVGCAPADLGPTCPLLATRTEWVRDVVRARKWAERGMLREYVGPVSAPLFEAIDVLDEELAAKQAADMERREREFEAQRDALPKPPTE